MIVYKYVVADRVDVLEHGQIRFTQPAALNDPFDTFPCFTIYKQQLQQTVLRDPRHAHLASSPEGREALLAVVDQILLRVPARLSLHFAILSVSKKKDHLLMWSHYANSHRGFVMGFDSESPFFQPGNGKAIDGLREVLYSKRRWPVPSEGLASLSEGEKREANLQFFFTKSEEWSYEEELRILANPRSADKAIQVPDGWPICLFKFPPEMLREIILGFAMPQEEQQRIATIISERYPHASLYRTSLDETEFKLQIRPYARPCVVHPASE